MGQCFLRDKEIAARIAQSLPVGEPLIEIGCGDGFLTEALLDAGHTVLGVEIDPEWLPKLKRRIHSRREFQLIARDALQLDWAALRKEYGPLQVTGNLPYHLASTILFNLFDEARLAEPAVTRIVVMLQREVAERITASTGGKAYGALTLLARYHGNLRYLFSVPADRFYPKPKVDGGVIEIAPNSPGNFPPVDYFFFRRIVRGCFAQRRKMLRNSIRIVNDLPEDWQTLDFDFTRRPEQLSFEEYVQLAQEMERLMNNNSERDGNAK